MLLLFEKTSAISRTTGLAATMRRSRDEKSLSPLTARWVRTDRSSLIPKRMTSRQAPAL
jgi:hypothetical protein